MDKGEYVFVSECLKPDPQGKDWVLGWGVVRITPWCLDSVFNLDIEAELRAYLLGGDFRAQYGTHEIGTTRFIPINNSKRILYTDLNGFRRKNKQR